MTPLPSLILPILVAALAVFVLSSIVQTFVPWHKRDFGNVPNDDAFIEAIREMGVPPGDYLVPNPRLADGPRAATQKADFPRFRGFSAKIILSGDGGIAVRSPECGSASRNYPLSATLP